MAPPMKIHGKWYDTTGFNHPGGPVMLSLGHSRDATALFEAHHPFTSRAKLNTLLKKYEVSDGKGKLMDPRDEDICFEWPSPDTKIDNSQELPAEAPVSEFAMELRTMVKSYFQSEAERRGVSLIQAMKATPYRWFEIAVFFMLFAMTLPAFFRGEHWTLVATPLIYWVLGVNLFHDASHFALSRNWKINVIGTYVGWYFSSPFEWYHQHVIGHHAYPNIPNKDPDLYHNGMMERHTKTLRWRPMHQYQTKTWYPIWVIGTFAMNYLKPAQMMVSGYYNRAVKMIPTTQERKIQHILGRVFTFCLCHVWPFFWYSSWSDAFLFAALPVAIVSVSFMACSQVNHLTAPNIDVFSKDYYAHQVLTSHTFAPTSKLVFWFTGGLNCQIEHHLFPTINHIHLPYLQPKVKAICKKHDVFYHESATFSSAIGKYVEHLESLAARPQDQEASCSE